MRQILSKAAKAWFGADSTLNAAWTDLRSDDANGELFNEDEFEGQWRGYTLVLLVGAFYYPYWSWVYEMLGFDFKDSSLGRIGVAGMCLGWALALVATPFKRRAAGGYFLIMLAVTSYHLYLVHLNHFALPLILSLVIGVTIGAAPMTRLPQVVAFFVFALGGCMIGDWEQTRAARWVTLSLITFTSFLTVYQLVERLIASRAVKRSEMQLKTIFERAPVGMIVLSKDRRFVRANAAYQQMLGYSEEELAQKTVVDVTYEEDRDETVEVSRRLAEDRDYMVFGLEKRKVRKDGRPVWVRVTGSSLDDEGRVLSVVEDIDLQHHQRQAIAEAQKRIEDERAKSLASSKMASLGEMAGGVAHEINNPLAIIIGKCQSLMVKAEQGGLTPIALKESLGSIEKTSHRIARIVKGLRTFARDAEADPFLSSDLSEIVQETLSFCQSRLSNHGVDVRIRIEAGTLFECRATQISQVLLNLINNAHDAIEELPERWIEISAVEKDGWISIRVMDSGAGIPAGLADRLMEPFFTTKDVGKGTGLGLSISRGIVEGHGGRLSLDRSCKNTCFVIEVPKRQALSSAA